MKIKSLVSLFCVTLITAPTLLQAQDSSKGTIAIPSVAPTNSWEYSFATYGWLASLDGQIGANGLPPQDVDLPLDTILENLDFSAYLAFEANKGNWGYFADFQYLKLSADDRVEKTDIDVSITDFMFSLGMQYRIYQNDKTSIYAYGALQYNYMDTKIKFSGGQNASFGGSHDWIDPAVGVKIRHQLNEHWFCSLAAEVGGFGISSDFTWQAMASVGYKINDCWALVASYRHQYVDYTDGGIVYDVNVGGPLIGLIYNF